MPRRKKNTVVNATLAILSDGEPRTTSELAKLTETTMRGMQSTLNRMAVKGLIVRDGMPLRMGWRQRLYTLPQFEYKLPQSDNPWWESPPLCATRSSQLA